MDDNTLATQSSTLTVAPDKVEEYAQPQTYIGKAQETRAPTDEEAATLTWLPVLLAHFHLALAPNANDEKDSGSILRLTRGANSLIYILSVAPLDHSGNAVVDDNATTNIVWNSAGTTHPSPGVSKLVFRSSKLKFVTDERGKIENEVAAMSLFRSGTSPEVGRLVPAVHAWSLGEGDMKPWMLMEFKEGIPADIIFPELNHAEQAAILHSIAKIIHALQTIPLPLPTHANAPKFGGFGFIDRTSFMSAIKVTKSPMGYGGPWMTARDMFVDVVGSQIARARESSAVNGWRGRIIEDQDVGDLMAKWEQVVRNKDELWNEVSGFLEGIEPSFVHGDFGGPNLLIDPETHAITCVNDFEFAQAASPHTEFCMSVANEGFIYTSTRDRPLDLDAFDTRLQNALLAGFPSSTEVQFQLPVEASQKDKDTWRWAETLERALASIDVDGSGGRGAWRPSTLPAMDQFAQLYWHSEDVMPWFAMFFAKISPEVKEKTMAEQSTRFWGDWKRWGFVR